MFRIIFTLSFVAIIFSQVGGQTQVQRLRNRDPALYRNVEYLDSERKYLLEWEVDWKQRRIQFEVTVETRGFVLLGLAKPREEIQGDIVVGGVDQNGEYFTDRHGVRSGVAETDLSQDWELERANENGTHTNLRFSRAFVTCDPGDDYEINEHDTTMLIWAYGENDNPPNGWKAISQRFGLYGVNLLSPNIIPRSLQEASFRSGPPPDSVISRENMNLWTISTSLRLPQRETLYQCTIHKSPRLQRMHHIVGFRTRLDTAEAVRHTHHLDLYRCRIPSGQRVRRLFESMLNTEGEDCYELNGLIGDYCTELVNAWSIGGRITMYPDHAGQPFGDYAEEEYYLMNVHYDNPDLLPNLELTVNMDMYYTSELRQNDLGLMTLGLSTPGSPSFIIPPRSSAHRVYGHCSSQCTDSILPDDGIRITMTQLHTHNSGRKAYIRHFRGNRELPYITRDETYSPNFQNYRVLQQEVVVLPGDHLTMESENDNTRVNGTVMGGYSTSQEMSIAFISYYPKIYGLSSCGSHMRDEYFMRRYLRVSNITWNEDELDFVATSPPHLRGLTMEEISNRVDWTPQLRYDLQQDHRDIPQRAFCAVIGDTVDNVGGSVRFPNNAVEYIPDMPDLCSTGNNRVANNAL